MPLLELNHDDAYIDGTIEWVVECDGDKCVTADVDTTDTAPYITVYDGDIEVTYDKEVYTGTNFTSFEVVVEIEGKTIQQHIKEGVRMEIYSATNVLLIVVVSLLTYKFILPRLKIGWVVRKFKDLLFKPFKKIEKEVTEEWEKE